LPLSELVAFAQEAQFLEVELPLLVAVPAVADTFVQALVAEAVALSSVMLMPLVRVPLSRLVQLVATTVPLTST
jgi:hypothetical protein